MMLKLAAGAMLAAAVGGPPAELAELFGGTHAVPAEVAAETLLRLAEDERWPADLRVSTLQQAFERAVGANEAMARRLAGGRRETGAAHLLARSYDLGLDRLTLEGRAVEALSAVQPELARKLFDRMAYPALGSPGCEVLLVERPDAYFRAAAVVARRSFPADGPGRAAFVGEIVKKLHQPGAATATVLLVAKAEVTAVQRKELERLLAEALEGMAGTDRGFSTTAWELADALKELKSPVVEAAGRSYALRHMKQARCEDSASRAAEVDRMRRAFGLTVAVQASELLESPMEEDDPPREGAPEGGPRPLRERALAALEAAQRQQGEARHRALEELARMLSDGGLGSPEGLVWLAACQETLAASARLNPAVHEELAGRLERGTNVTLAAWTKVQRLLPRKPIR
jgi:hypothetical protein